MLHDELIEAKSSISGLKSAQEKKYLTLWVDTLIGDNQRTIASLDSLRKAIADCKR